MNRRQLDRFIRLRNKSEHSSNMQFAIDAETAGFKVAELGQPRVIIGEHGIKSYEWFTRHGTLREHRGILTLETEGRL